MKKRYFGNEPSAAFAHRGGAKLWPENTTMAFEGSIALGIRYIETDLHVTRDGHIVCFHDLTLDRTTDGHGALAERTLAELRELNAGHHFSPDGVSFPHRGSSDPRLRIPTLDEALALDPDVCFNLEIKPREPDMTEALRDFIDAREVHHRVLVASGDPVIERRFRALNDGRFATSASSRSVLLFWLGVRTGLHRLIRYPFDALQVPTTSGRLRVVDERFISAAHRHGIEVHVWTINEPAEMRRLLELGVDAVQSDRPDLLAEVLGIERRGA